MMSAFDRLTAPLARLLLWLGDPPRRWALVPALVAFVGLSLLWLVLL